MTSVPRWISIILSKQGLIEIHDEDDLSYIKRALNRERISSGHDIIFNRSRFLCSCK